MKYCLLVFTFPKYCNCLWKFLSFKKVFTDTQQCDYSALFFKYITGPNYSIFLGILLSTEASYNSNNLIKLSQIEYGIINFFTRLLS